MIRGSWFRYTELGSEKVIYTSLISDQVIEKKDDGTMVMTFQSADGRVNGNQTYTRTDQGLRIQFKFGWKGERPVRVELAAGTLWTKPLLGGSLLVDGVLSRPLNQTDYPPNASPAVRRFGNVAQEYQFSSSMGKLTVRGSRPEWTLFDGRGYKESWAQDRELLWLGVPNLYLPANDSVEMDLDLRFESNFDAYKKETLKLTASPLAQAMMPKTEALPLIPKPKEAQVDGSNSFVVDEKELKIDAPLGSEEAARVFLTGLKRNWNIPDLVYANSPSAKIIFRIQDMGLPREAYELRVSPSTIIAVGQDFAGLSNAAKTLSWLSVSKGGKLTIPVCTIRDWPSISWRGVQIFGGPQVRTFQTKLAERVISPLKFNNVIMQCDRTRWKSFPKMHMPHYSAPEDLKRTFDMYRSLGIEPTPLIQSLGHMEWFFANGSEIELAVNPSSPFTIDPRKPGSADALEKLWGEAIELLRPKVVHFGCDEIDTRGMSSSPETVTELWEKAMPILERIATRNNVKGIIWGDKALAPGQAIDAALGDDPLNAQKRRDAIPKNFWIGDWHYKNDNRSDRFMISLNLWKSHNLWPIGAGWFNSDNIKGLTEACYRSGAGYLQTTWAGFDHNEENMLREFRQFAAYVVAADYAWSGRNELPSQLGYNSSEVLTKLYFAEPSPIRPLSGFALDGTSVFSVENFKFRSMRPIEFVSAFEPSKTQKPTEVTLETQGMEGKLVAIAMDVSQVCEDRDPIAEIEITYGDGRKATRNVLYGTDVRAREDIRPMYRSIRSGNTCVVKVPLESSQPITSIRLKSTNSYSGLRVLGITAI